jgi:acyl carrier protein
LIVVSISIFLEISVKLSFDSCKKHGIQALVALTLALTPVVPAYGYGAGGMFTNNSGTEKCYQYPAGWPLDKGDHPCPTPQGESRHICHGHRCPRLPAPDLSQAIVDSPSASRPLTPELLRQQAEDTKRQIELMKRVAKILEPFQNFLNPEGFKRLFDLVLSSKDVMGCATNLEEWFGFAITEGAMPPPVEDTATACRDTGDSIQNILDEVKTALTIKKSY